MTSQLFFRNFELKIMRWIREWSYAKFGGTEFTTFLLKFWKNLLGTEFTNVAKQILIEGSRDRPHNCSYANFEWQIQGTKSQLFLRKVWLKI